jgi:bacteriocin-like protein
MASDNKEAIQPKRPNPAGNSELTDEQLNQVTGGSFDIENPTTIGSGTSGAGAGKIKFNEISPPPSHE